MIAVLGQHPTALQKLPAVILLQITKFLIIKHGHQSKGDVCPNGRDATKYMQVLDFIKWLTFLTVSYIHTFSESLLFACCPY